jgi:hypothetical protein
VAGSAIELPMPKILALLAVVTLVASCASRPTAPGFVAQALARRGIEGAAVAP